MSERTGIAWCDATFNPWSGCTRVSAGCAHCYAAALPPRMRRGAAWGADAQRVPASEAYWAQPLAWERRAAREGGRRYVFAASTADIGERGAVQDAARERLWALAARTPHLVWLCLTKRPAQFRQWWREHAARGGRWPANVWAGVSVEDQRAADTRIALLLDLPSPVWWLSCEPLLGPLDLAPWLGGGVGWVIVGGESGRNARPMHPDWARSLRDQCIRADVPFFFKQWGEWGPLADDETPLPHGVRLMDVVDGDVTASTTLICGDGGARPTQADIGETAMLRLGKHAAGDLLDGVRWQQRPEPEPIRARGPLRLVWADPHAPSDTADEVTP